MTVIPNEFAIKKVVVDKQIKESILNKLNLLNNKKIIVLGDVGLDEYVIGSVKRISPEAPVPVVEVETEEKRLGLAANVAQNITSLGGQVSMLSVVGNDMGAQLLRQIFDENKISWNEMIIDSNRPTTRKTRVMAGPHHIVRIDYELKQYLSESVKEKVKEKFKKLICDYDGVIIQDYAKGFFSEDLVQEITTIAKKNNKPIFVDPNRNSPLNFYRGCTLFKPNYDESLALTNTAFDDLKLNPNKVYTVGRMLQSSLQTQEVVLTRGKDGMTIFSGDEIIEVPTFARKVFDVTGAGDTVIASLALSQVAGFSLVESCILANIAAGNVVAKVGCVPCDLQEMKEFLKTL